MRIYRFGPGGCLLLLLVFLLAGNALRFLIYGLGQQPVIVLIALFALGYVVYRLRRTSSARETGPEYTITDDDNEEEDKNS